MTLKQIITGKAQIRQHIAISIMVVLISEKLRT